MEKSEKSSFVVGIQIVIYLFVASFLVCWFTAPMGFGTKPDKMLIWDYGHGRGTSAEVSDKKLDAFYNKVMAIPPNERGKLQKYKKKMMRESEGWEYESDAAWNKYYKKLIHNETVRWKEKYKK